MNPFACDTGGSSSSTPRIFWFETTCHSQWLQPPSQTHLISTLKYGMNMGLKWIQNMTNDSLVGASVWNRFGIPEWCFVDWVHWWENVGTDCIFSHHTSLSKEKSSCIESTILITGPRALNPRIIWPLRSKQKTYTSRKVDMWFPATKWRNRATITTSFMMTSSPHDSFSRCPILVDVTNFSPCKEHLSWIETIEIRILNKPIIITDSPLWFIEITIHLPVWPTQSAKQPVEHFLVRCW